MNRSPFGCEVSLFCSHFFTGSTAWILERQSTRLGLSHLKVRGQRKQVEEAQSRAGGQGLGERKLEKV